MITKEELAVKEKANAWGSNPFRIPSEGKNKRRIWKKEGSLISICRKKKKNVEKYLSYPYAWGKDGAVFYQKKGRCSK